MINKKVWRKGITSHNRWCMHVLFLLMVTLITGCYTEERIDRVMELFIVQDNTVGDEIKGYSGTVLPRGTTAKLQAFAVFDDGRTGDVSEQVNWESTEPDIVKVDERGNIEALVVSPALEDEEPTLFEVEIIASKHGVSTTYTVSVTNAVVEFIELSPPRLELNKGNQATLIATGIYTDGLTKVLGESDGLVWESNAPNLASVTANGIVTANGVDQGGVYVTASIGEISGRSDVSVLERSLTGIRMVPEELDLVADVPFQLAVIGTYTDGFEEEISPNEFIWESSDPNVGTVSPEGIVKGVTIGNTDVFVRFKNSDNGIFRALSQVTIKDAKLTGIQITPESDVRLPVGFSQDFKAIGYFDDDSEPLDITTSVSWVDSSGGAIVQIDTDGKLTGKSVGTADIHAELANVSSNTSSVIVDNATLKELRLTPLRVPALPINHTYSIVAEGVFSNDRVYDVSSLVTWRSSARGVVGIDHSGIVTGLAEGTTEIRAALNGLVSETPSTVEVIGGELESIIINAKSTDVNKGLTTTLEAFGRFSDGNIVPITDIVKWQTSDPSVMTITNGVSIGGITLKGGVATGQDIGEATVWAELPTDSIGNIVSNRLDMAVSEALLEEITVVGEEESIPVGLSRTYKAMGKFSDDTTKELSEDDVYWITADRNVATVDLDTGELIAHQEGVTELKAVAKKVERVEGEISVSISKEQLTGVYIQYPNGGTDTPRLAKGESVQLTLFGEYTDGIDRDITNNSFVKWEANSVSVNNNGLVETNSSTPIGTHEVQAKVSDSNSGDFSATSPVNVTAAVPVDIEIYVPSHDPSSNADGELFHNFRGVVRLRVRRVYSDGTKGNTYNGNIIWGSDDPNVNINQEGEFRFTYEKYTGVNDINDRTDNRLSSVTVLAYDSGINIGGNITLPVRYLTEEGLREQKNSTCHTIGYGYFGDSRVDSDKCYSVLSTGNYLVAAPAKREVTGVASQEGEWGRFRNVSNAQSVCDNMNSAKVFGLSNWKIDNIENEIPIQRVYEDLFQTYSFDSSGAFLTKHWPNGATASALPKNRRGYRFGAYNDKYNINVRRKIYHNASGADGKEGTGNQHAADYVSCAARLFYDE